MIQNDKMAKNVKYTLFSFSLGKSSGKISDVKDFGRRKFRTVKFSDTLLMYFVINFLFTYKKKIRYYCTVDSEFLLEEDIYNALIYRILNTKIYIN